MQRRQWLISRLRRLLPITKQSATIQSPRHKNPQTTTTTKSNQFVTYPPSLSTYLLCWRSSWTLSKKNTPSFFITFFTRYITNLINYITASSQYSSNYYLDYAKWPWPFCGSFRKSFKFEPTGYIWKRALWTHLWPIMPLIGADTVGTISSSTSKGKWSEKTCGCGQPITLFCVNHSDDRGPSKPNGVIVCFA